MCDYTLQGLVKILPIAFKCVSLYWVRKAFQRSDRYLALYAMEKAALPFAVREFMVKCWKRHRDVPTTIDQVVDQTFNDIRLLQVDYKKREESNGIKPDKLMKVNSLLAALQGSVGTMPLDGMGERMRQVQAKMAASNASDDACRTYDITMQKFHNCLKKAGRLGPLPTAAYYASMEDKNDLSRLPIMRQTRKRLQHTVHVPASIQVVLEDMPQTFLEEIRVESTSVPPLQPPEDNQESSTDKEDCVAWVECVQCSKWRVLPRGVVATTLHDDWTCSNGASWRSTGLNCDVVEDADEDVM